MIRAAARAAGRRPLGLVLESTCPRMTAGPGCPGPGPWSYHPAVSQSFGTSRLPSGRRPSFTKGVDTSIAGILTRYRARAADRTCERSETPPRRAARAASPSSRARREEMMLPRGPRPGTRTDTSTVASATAASDTACQRFIGELAIPATGLYAPLGQPAAIVGPIAPDSVSATANMPRSLVRHVVRGRESPRSVRVDLLDEERSGSHGARPRARVPLAGDWSMCSGTCSGAFRTHSAEQGPDSRPSDPWPRPPRGDAST